MEPAEQLNKHGFVVVDSIIEPGELHSIALNSSAIGHEGVGTRNLLMLDWVQALAKMLKQHPCIKPLLPGNAKAVQCNYFLKNEQSNWSVTLHRDLSVPVKAKVESEQWCVVRERRCVVCSTANIRIGFISRIETPS